MLNVIQEIRKAKGFNNSMEVINALGILAKLSPEILEWLITQIYEPVPKEENINPHYPLAIVVCMATEANVNAMEFVLDFWSRLPKHFREYDEDIREGMKYGRREINIATEDVIQYLIGQINANNQYMQFATEILERLLANSPKVLQRGIDKRGNSWFSIVSMSDNKIEEIQQSILSTIKIHPPTGAMSEFPLISVITRWVLKSPSFLIRLVGIVANSDARLLADELNHHISSKRHGLGGWEFDEKQKEHIRLMIKRLLDPEPSISNSELLAWTQSAENSRSEYDLATWSMNVVKWKKCYFFYCLYLNAFGSFWITGMSLVNAGGWEKIKEWNPYSMAALASFCDWKWSSPMGEGQVDWQKTEEEFRKGTGLAISFVQNQDYRIVEILKSLVIAKSDNQDDSIFGKGSQRRKANIDERIAAVYALARLSKIYPEVVDFLFPIAQKLSNIYLDDWDNSVVPFSEFREHIIRSLGYVHRPNREIVQLMLNTMKKDHETDWGHISIIERGVEAIENPLPEAVGYLISEYERIENPSWKECILEPLSTVEGSTPEINKIMFSALNDDHRLSYIAATYFSNLSNLDTLLLNSIFDIAPRNIYSLRVLAKHVTEMSSVKLRQLSRIARRRTREIGDDYRSVLMRFQERLSELETHGSPREFGAIGIPASLKFIRGMAIVLGVVLLLGILVVLDTVYGATQSIIQAILGQTIKQWIVAHPSVFVGLFIGLGISIGLLSWLVEKLKEKIK